MVVADLYLRRGRSSGVHDPDVLRLAELTGRTPASISRRLGNFEGTAHPGRGLKPVTGVALQSFRMMQTDHALRDEMVRAATSRLLAGERITALKMAPPGSRLVMPEEFSVEP